MSKKPDAQLFFLSISYLLRRVEMIIFEGNGFNLKTSNF